MGIGIGTGGKTAVSIEKAGISTYFVSMEYFPPNQGPVLPRQYRGSCMQKSFYIPDPKGKLARNAHLLPCKLGFLARFYAVMGHNPTFAFTSRDRYGLLQSEPLPGLPRKGHFLSFGTAATNRRENYLGLPGFVSGRNRRSLRRDSTNSTRGLR